MINKEFKKTVARLQSSDKDEVENVIRELGNSHDKRAIPILMDMLLDENNINILNALALSLGDLRAQEALPLIMSYIQDPKNKNKNGSFVYALQNLDCKDYFLDVVDMICSGHYEVYHSAFDIFESIVDEVSFADKMIALDRLKKQKEIESIKPPSKHPEYDRLNFINDAIELLED